MWITILVLISAALFNGLLVMTMWRLIFRSFGGFKVSFWVAFLVGLILCLVGAAPFEPTIGLGMGFVLGTVDAASFRMMRP